jgi:hypothetical protein
MIERRPKGVQMCKREGMPGSRSSARPSRPFAHNLRVRAHHVRAERSQQVAHLRQQNSDNRLQKRQQTKDSKQRTKESRQQKALFTVGLQVPSVVDPRFGVVVQLCGLVVVEAARGVEPIPVETSPIHTSP